MFKKILKGVLVVFVVLFFIGLFIDEPMEVESITDFGSPEVNILGIGASKKLKITSKVDELEIYEIKLNKGNCKLHYILSKSNPKKLKYGQSFSPIHFCENLKQAEIKTNEGDFTYSF